MPTRYQRSSFSQTRGPEKEREKHILEPIKSRFRCARSYKGRAVAVLYRPFYIGENVNEHQEHQKMNDNRGTYVDIV